MILYSNSINSEIYLALYYLALLDIYLIIAFTFFFNEERMQCPLLKAIPIH